MLRNSIVTSISLAPEIYARLMTLAKKMAKSKSELIKEMVLEKTAKDNWREVFAWGRKTKEKFNIKNEEDIIKIIND